MTVRDKDNGQKAMIKRMKTQLQIKVGVQGSEASQAHAGGEDTVADIASKHEFGIDVPQRSFIRETVDVNESKIQDILAQAAQKMTKGLMSPSQAGDWVGVQIQAILQDRIAQQNPPFAPLAQMTIDQKGSSTPLINTGQLRSSITYVAKVKK